MESVCKALKVICSAKVIVESIRVISPIYLERQNSLMNRACGLEVERTPMIRIAGRSIPIDVMNPTTALVNYYSGE